MIKPNKADTSPVYGIDHKSLKEMVLGKQIYIYGGGEIAEDVFVALCQKGFSVSGFIHNSPQDAYVKKYAKQILQPDRFFKSQTATKESFFVIIATSGYRKLAEQDMQNHGRQKGVDYLIYHAIQRNQAVIFLQDPSQDLVENLSAKLLASNNDPLSVCHVELVLQTGTINKARLALLVDNLEQQVPCTVTIHLEAVESLSGAKINSSRVRIKTQLEDLTSSTSYNLANAKAAISEAQAIFQKSGSITVVIEQTRSTNKTQIRRLVSLVNDLGLKCEVELKYPEDFNEVINLLGKDDSDIPTSYLWKFDVLSQKLTKYSSKPCVSRRVFPVIDAEGNYLLCSLYPKVKLRDLPARKIEAPQAIVLERELHDHCRICQMYGLHRWDNSLLKAYFNEEREYMG
jgi:hypothetical protein